MFAIAWIFVLGLLTLYFGDLLEGQHNPNRSVAGTEAAGTREVVLRRNRQGHYVVKGGINDRPVVFLLDTGATDVALSATLAKKLHLRLGQPFEAMTANGRVTAYSTVLNRVALGNIVLYQVTASVLPAMDGMGVLLGMSFLKQLELIQRGDQLTIRQHLSR